MATESLADRKAAEARAGSHRWLVLVVVSIAQLMVVLDATVVNIALPSAQTDLGFGDSQRQWIVTAYALAFGSLLLLGGRVGDLVGRKRIFLIALVAFAIASGARRGRAVLRRARRGARDPGCRRRHAGPGCAGNARHDLHRPARTRQGVRRVRHGRRRRRRRRAHPRRHPHPVPVLALVHVRQRVLRRGRVRRRADLHEREQADGASAHRPRRHRARRRRPVRRRVRLLAGRDQRLGLGGHDRVADRGCGVPDRVRPRRARGRAPAASAARCGRPRAGHGVRRRRHRRHRDVRPVPVPDLLPAGRQGVQPGRLRPGIPADDRLRDDQLEHLEHRHPAALRPAHRDHRRHGARLPRPRVPVAAGRPLVLCRERAARAGPDGARDGHGHGSVDEHRHGRRAAAGLRRRGRSGQHHAADRRFHRHRGAEHDRRVGDRELRERPTPARPPSSPRPTATRWCS